MLKFRRILATAASLVLAACSAADAAVLISDAATRHMSCASGTCTPTRKKATLNAADLAAMLAGGDVTVKTGSGAVTITVVSTFSWTSTHRLTLDAQENVSFRAPMVVAGQGAVTITTGDGTPGGTLLFFPGGKVDFWDNSGSIVVNGTSYTLVSDIATLASDVSVNPSGDFALAKDYDAKPDGGYNGPPLDTLNGGLEGLGHTISHFSVADRTIGAAFIDTIDQQGAVRDLAFAGARSVTVKHKPAAILAINNGGLISHVAVDGAVKALRSDAAAAGLVIFNYGTVDGCSASGSVLAPGANADAGGLAGVNENQGVITNSHASNTVAARLAGGFVMVNQGTISLSSASGAVTAQGHATQSYATGGFVALDRGAIDRSFATGDVHGGYGVGSYDAAAGGFAGELDAPNTITDSYATGAVSVGSAGGAGGFVGVTGGTMTTSWSSGAVSASDPGGAQGFSFYPTDKANLDYWDTDASGVSTACGGACPGVTGLTTAQFQSGLPTGFDPAIWAEDPAVNNGYPYLIANPPQ